MTEERRTCSVEGCDKPLLARGFCSKHYEQKRHFAKGWVRPGYDPICSVPGCGRPHKSKGLCKPHYERSRQSPHLLPNVPLKQPGMPRDGMCLVEGCEEPIASRGWCKAHYERWRKMGSTGPVGRLRGLSGAGSLNTDGYRVIDGKLEHRLVMASALGRPL